jgi:hypothetical protein
VITGSITTAGGTALGAGESATTEGGTSLGVGAGESGTTDGSTAVGVGAGESGTTEGVTSGGVIGAAGDEVGVALGLLPGSPGALVGAGECVGRATGRTRRRGAAE